MSTFELFINDDRYSVPNLRFLAASSEAWARTAAMQALSESPHHLGVELYSGDRRLFVQGSPLTPAQGPR